MTETSGGPLNNPLKAIALAYKEPDSLPSVLVSGTDELARLIIEIARNSEIPIQENRELVSLLDKQKSGPIVSPKALKVLSEVVAFLYHTDSLIKGEAGQSALPLPGKAINTNP